PRSSHPVISRVNASLANPIHYFVRDVPNEYRNAVADAFDEWNFYFAELTGRPVFSYEFVETTDSRYDLLVPGDIRYHIVQWDTIFLAPYRGSSMHFAHPMTGELFWGSILIQGARVVQEITRWYQGPQGGPLTSLDFDAPPQGISLDQRLYSTIRAIVIHEL